jgi:uncharacterized membrane protein
MIDDKVKAVLLAVIIVLGLLTAGQYWLEHRVVDPFSELAVLGPDRLIGDYPTSVSVGQNVTLYGYVSNHEAQVTYYDVRVKLGNSTTVANDTSWINSPSAFDYRVILRDGGNSTFPVQLAFSQPINNTKIIFELWELDVGSGAFEYAGLWGQILLNVTAG